MRREGSNKKRGKISTTLFLNETIRNFGGRGSYLDRKGEKKKEMYFHGTRRGAHLLVVETRYRSTRGRKREKKKGLQVLHIHLERKGVGWPMKGRFTFGKQPEKFVSTCVENRARETISIRGGTIVAGRNEEESRLEERGGNLVLRVKQWTVRILLGKRKFLSFSSSRMYWKFVLL